MDLPNIEKGMRILAEDINRISREVRASAVTSVVGGQVTRSQAGTSIVIDPTYIFDGGGASVPCPFGATKEVVGGYDFVRINQNTVATPNARWPVGMGPGYSPYYIRITETTYIYVKILYVDDDVVVNPEPYGVTIDVSPELKENTVNEEYVLVSVVAVENGAIKTVTNTCANVTANPCNLKWN